MKKVLIIEDDFFAAKVYGKTFTDAGYEVATSFDGESGLRRVGEFRPDLVQMDLMVPKLNGPDIIERIRANPAWKSLPVLVLSSCSDQGLAQQARLAGATAVMSKLSYSPQGVLQQAEALLAAANAPAPAPAPCSPPATEASPPPPGADAAAALPQTQPAPLARARPILAELRLRMHGLVKSRGGTDQLPSLRELRRLAHSLAAQASLNGLVRMAHLAGALEVLLQELHEEPRQVTPSTLHTLARSLDCLQHLSEEPPASRDEFVKSHLILAVDDEPLSLGTIATALAKVDLSAVSLNDPELALAILASNRFNLIFLDAEMPVMDGFELCRRLRALPTNKTTPVVYVTGLSDFGARASATLSGGNDLIAKPFLLIELAVKALTFLVQPRPAPLGPPSPQPASH